jgi:hypothetical protein
MSSFARTSFYVLTVPVALYLLSSRTTHPAYRMSTRPSPSW